MRKIKTHVCSVFTEKNAYKPICCAYKPSNLCGAKINYASSGSNGGPSIRYVCTLILEPGNVTLI